MNTKILGTPPSNDGSQGKGRASQSQTFNLQTRRVNVDWDVTTIGEASIQEKGSQRAIETIGLFIVSQNIELVVDLVDTNILGRSYPQNGYFDGIDFSAFDAYKLGVSRRHVILKRYGQQLLIVDNNSSNGTYLNRALLHPLQPYYLQNDDSVRMGALDFLIKFD